jgi:hypothetical protein
MTGYKGLGHYPQPKRRNGFLLAAIVAVVVVLGVAATALFVRISTTIPGQALAAAGGAPPPATTSKANDPLQPKTTRGPQVPGWQVIELSNGGSFNTGKAYDVPPGWHQLPNDIITFGDHAELSVLTPTIYKQGYCPGTPNSWRSMAGLFTAPSKGNIEIGVVAAAQMVANQVFTTKDRVQPKTEISDPQVITVDGDKKGVFVTAKLTVPVTEKDKCSSPSVTIAVMMASNKGEGDNAVMLAMGDSNVPDATPDQDLRQIVTSFHSAT